MLYFLAFVLIFRTLFSDVAERVVLKLVVQPIGECEELCPPTSQKKS